jgi:hypothetical protein
MILFSQLVSILVVFLNIPNVRKRIPVEVPVASKRNVQIMKLSRAVQNLHSIISPSRLGAFIWEALGEFGMMNNTSATSWELYRTIEQS